VPHCVRYSQAGPNSATGEDLAELHLHGGKAVVRAIETELSYMKGLRHAEAGEYTRRAFENGRIDLNQADGLSDLLFAETERQRKAALSMMGDIFGKKINLWQDDILHISALIESELDFSDEDDVDSGNAAVIIDKAKRIEYDIIALLDTPPIERLRDGLKVALGGAPNSGKSTLLNALVGRDAAIVSDIAGTTRDVIEIPIAMDGLAFIFLDTAGLRDESDDRIENIGIKRARQAFDQADIILWLGDDPPEDYNDKLIIIAAKSDIQDNDRIGALSLSAKTGEGLDALRTKIITLAKDMLPPEDSFVVNERQREHLQVIIDALSAIYENQDWLVMGENARLARKALDALTGRSHTEELLDTIFGKFCIGK